MQYSGSREYINYRDSFIYPVSCSRTVLLIIEQFSIPAGMLFCTPLCTTKNQRYFTVIGVNRIYFLHVVPFQYPILAVLVAINVSTDGCI